MINSKHDVGEPCLTPISVVMIAVPKILLVTLYIAMMTLSIAAPQPRFFSTVKSICLGTRSYALEKSTKVMNNLHFFFFE